MSAGPRLVRTATSTPRPAPGTACSPAAAPGPGPGSAPVRQDNTNIFLVIDNNMSDVTTLSQPRTGSTAACPRCPPRLGRRAGRARSRCTAWPAWSPAAPWTPPSTPSTRRWPGRVSLASVTYHCAGHARVPLCGGCHGGPAGPEVRAAAVRRRGPRGLDHKLRPRLQQLRPPLLPEAGLRAQRIAGELFLAARTAQ